MSAVDPRDVKQRYRDQLMRLPNVVGVGVGPKLVAGKPSGVLAIRVYVRSKVAQDRLGEDERIPAELEGIPTDVIEQSELHAR